MERGELGGGNQSVTVFVFEGLVAQCRAPRRESLMVKAGRWSLALAQWDWDIQVLDHMYDMVSRFESQLEVLTWHPPGFAEAVHDQIWKLGVPVSETKSAASYRLMSQRIATDPRITTVYDADPNHRFGYGFKTREFVAGQM